MKAPGEPPEAMPLLQTLRAKLEGPIAEVTVHFIMSVYALILIFLIEELLPAIKLNDKIIPILGIKLEDWMFYLDIVALSGILIVGFVKALREMW